MDGSIFTRTQLDDQCEIYTSVVIPAFDCDANQFEEIWEMHPEAYHTIRILGKDVLTPRWQQSYGKNYRYTGSLNNALPIPDTLSIFLKWSQENIDPRLNGILMNWYDGSKDHYIGAHRDDTRDLCEGSPIVTISLGQERIFRLRPYQEKGYQDVTVGNGEVIVVPWHTNQAWTHEVPNFKRYDQRRISVTLRAYL